MFKEIAFGFDTRMIDNHASDQRRRLYAWHVSIRRHFSAFLPLPGFW